MQISELCTLGNRPDLCIFVIKRAEISGRYLVPTSLIFFKGFGNNCPAFIVLEIGNLGSVAPLRWSDVSAGFVMESLKETTELPILIN